MPLPACALALVLLMDVSNSVSPARYAMQRDGTAAAFRSAAVRAAIAQTGDVAVTVVEWSATSKVTVPWTVLHTDADVGALADSIAGMPTAHGTMTYMGQALAGAVDQMDGAPCTPERRVVDISGDGQSNAAGDGQLPMPNGHEPPEGGEGGRTGDPATDGVARPAGQQGNRRMVLPFRAAHRMAEDAGIQVNGLPIVTQVEPGLARWYAANVPANGGFTVVSEGFGAFREAMVRKLSYEVSGLQSPDGAAVRFASR